MNKRFLALLLLILCCLPAGAVQQAYHKQIIVADRDFEEFYQYLDPNSNPINLTGYSVDERIVDTKGNLLLDCSSYISISSPTTGMIHILIPASVTQPLTWTNGLYDIKLTGPSGQVPPFMQGAVQLEPFITP